MHSVQLQNTGRVQTRIHRMAFKVWLSLVTVLFSFIAFQSSAVQASAQANLLVLGDSLSAAYGMPTEQGWVALLQQKLQAEKKQIKVQNASLSGETTSGGLQRLPVLLKQYAPHYVIIELGANDALRGQNLRVTERNLARMIEMSQKQGAKVMLLGIRLPTNYGPAYDERLGQMYIDLAERYGLVFDPFFLMEVALEPHLMQDDGLHPNTEAQPLILKRLWPLVQTLVNRGAH